MFYIVEETDLTITYATEGFEKALEQYRVESQHTSRWHNPALYYSSEEFEAGDYLDDPNALCLYSTYHYPTDEPQEHRAEFRRRFPEIGEWVEKALSSVVSW